MSRRAAAIPPRQVQYSPGAPGIEERVRRRPQRPLLRPSVQAAESPLLRSSDSAPIYNHMVARSELTDPALDRLFRALADSTRRDIVARVMAGAPASISTLADRYDMSFAAVQKHVGVLEEAGLVTKHPRGRERLVRGNPERIARARELLAELESLWRARFSQLDDVLADPNLQE